MILSTRNGSILIGWFILFLSGAWAQTNTINNPVIWADIPDISIIRVDSVYYMTSTTMHMNPGIPIMESKDLVNWKTIGYVYQTLANTDETNLLNGKNDYSHGSWAASLRYKNGTYYVLVPGKSSGKTHLYSTSDIHKGPWKEVKLPFYHDPSLLLDDDGRNYVVYGGGDIRIVELSADLSGVKAGGVNKILIANATAASGGSGGLNAEGAHIEKIGSYYYVFTICWPSGMGRTELVHRSTTLMGTYEGQIALNSKGVAQGSVIQAPDGKWFGYLFQDNGAVGRSPWIMPVTWSNDWPIFNGGTAPATLSMKAPVPMDGYGMVSSDDFSSPVLPLEWQWNHNPVNTHWSLSAREGFMRIISSRVDGDFLNARNTLTQRSYGPKSSAQTLLETTGLKDGDIAGLGALQAKYGYVAVKVNGTNKSIVMSNGTTQIASTPLNQDKVHLRIDMDFTNRTDKATFYYSLDGNTWTAIGNTLQMSYTLPHFMGYRFALFNYATKSAGGYADFDHFKIGKSYNSTLAFNLSNIKQSAYLGDTLILPGTLQVENYDEGGLNVSFYDIDQGNSGGEYRDDDVDLVANADAKILGYTLVGEWLEYTVNIQSSGSLYYSCLVASGADGAKFSLTIDGQPFITEVIVPNTGDWNTFVEVEGLTASVSPGIHLIKLSIDGSYFNLDWIRFTTDPITGLKNTIDDKKVRPPTEKKYDLLGRVNPWLGITPTKN